MANRQTLIRTPGDGEAFHGYLIRVSHLSGACWIEKGGVMIGYAKDVDDAKHIIRDVLGA